MAQGSQVKAESIALMQALLARKDAAAEAREAFRRAYPDVPQAMIDTAAFHVAVDGIEATVDWLAAIEEFIREPTSAGIDYGAMWHVVYHLYNYQQFQALMPLWREGIREQLKDVQLFISEGDSAAANEVLKRLMDAFGGDVAPPGVG